MKKYDRDYQIYWFLVTLERLKLEDEVTPVWAWPVDGHTVYLTFQDKYTPSKFKTKLKRLFSLT